LNLSTAYVGPGIINEGRLDRVAIFDREDIPSFSLFKIATPKSEFPQLIASVRTVGLRVMASRLGGHPKQKPRNGKEFTMVATYPASPGRDNNLGL
jgi:hypothetical protein